MSNFTLTVYDHIAFTALIGSASFALIAHALKNLRKAFGRRYWD